MAAEVPDPVPAVYLADDPAHRPGDPAPVRLLAHDPAPDLGARAPPVDADLDLVEFF